MLMGLAAGGKKKAAAPPATPPTLLSATVAVDGATIALVFTAPVSPMLPASAATGLTIIADGVSAAITSTSTASATITLTMTATIYIGQVVTVAYTPGNITDSAPTALAAFTATSVTNSSTVAAPYVSTKSLAFDGVNESSTRAEDVALDFTTAMTASAWVKASGSNTSEGGLVSHGGDITSNFSWYMSQDGTDRAKLGVFISGDGTISAGHGKYYRSSITAFDGTWHHVAVTFGASTLKIYIDGTLDASVTKVWDNAVASLFNTTAALNMGALSIFAPSDFFYNGRINNVSLWAATFSGAEVSALSNSGKPADLTLHSQYANCVTWYKAGDGDDPTISNGIIDTKSSLNLTGTNMESGDVVTDAP